MKLQKSNNVILKFIVILLLICSADVEAISCQDFPKVFGGTDGHTSLNQIDVYGDYLSLAGYTYDKTLTGLSSNLNFVPYLAISSIETSGKYYWAKALILKLGSQFNGAQFSTDGPLIIAHSADSLNNCFIVVFYAPTGGIFSTRTYSSTVQGVQNYYFNKRSMIISSGATPMAYVHSNIQTSSVTGHYLFKFDPLSFSSSSIWSKESAGSSHLGLTFGRNENFLYVSSMYSGSSVQLLSTNGTFYWYCTTYDGYWATNNHLQYKWIDSDTDMVISTSGSVDYNRIFSKSTYPYDVISSKAFRYSTTGVKDVYAIYIIDKDNLVSLYSSTTGLTELATVDFITEKISFKTALPCIQTIKSAVFASSSVFYAGLENNQFSVDESCSNIKSINTFKQSIVFSSNSTMNRCYSLPTPPSVITEFTFYQTLPSFTMNKTSFYIDGMVSFIEDITTKTTVDIQQSQISRMTTCLLFPFTVNHITTVQTSTTSNGRMNDINIPITPFSATVNCGTSVVSWTYSLVDCNDNHIIVPSVDLFDVDAKIGNIILSKSKPVGTYQVKVIGTLPDLVTSTEQIRTIVILPNSQPQFQTNLTNLTVFVMTSKDYIFPPILDADGDTRYISEVKEKTSGLLPSFITLSTDKITITPSSLLDIGIYKMIAVITDQKVFNKYLFTIEIISQPPILTQSYKSSVVLNFGETIIYNLPLSFHPLGLSYSTSIQSAPQFVQLIKLETQLSISPKNCSSDFGTHNVTIKLQDSIFASFNYSITLEVKNLPPVFSGNSLIEDQKVLLKTFFYQAMPQFHDPEGCPLVVSTTPQLIQSFVKVQESSIIYTPNQLYQLGKHEVNIIIADSQGLNDSRNFNLIVYQLPKFNKTIPKYIDLLASNQATYNLPIGQTSSDLYVVHNRTLPRFVRFSFPQYNFLPDKVSDQGISIIEGTLCNSDACIRFNIILNVINLPPYFKDKITNQMLLINTLQSSKLPMILDRERHPISINAHEIGQLNLPSFVKFNISTLEFVYTPTLLDLQKQNYTIQVDLKDSLGSSSSQTFNISLQRLPNTEKAIDNYNQIESSLINEQNFRPPNSSENQSNSSQTKSDQLNQSLDNDRISQSQNHSDASLEMFNLMKRQFETQIINIEIIKVTRDQRAIIQIKNSNKSLNQSIADFVSQLSDSYIEISVIQQGTSQKIQFQIGEKELNRSLFYVNLKYPVPSKFSNSENLDILKVVVVNRIQIQDKGILIILPEKSQSQAKIPPQLTSNIEKFVERFIKDGRLSLTQSGALNLLIAFLIQIIWVKLEDMTFLVINSLLAISISGTPSLIQSVMLKYIFFDILYPELWLSDLMAYMGLDFEKVQNDTAINIQLQTNGGYDSKQFLKNSGSSIIYLLVYLLTWSGLLLFSILSRCSTVISSLKLRLQKNIMWNQSLSLLMSQFSPLYLCCIINFYNMRFKGDDNVTISSAFLSIIVFIAIFSSLLLVCVKVWRVARNMNHIQVNELQTKFQPLVQSLNHNIPSTLICIWKPIILIRQALTLTILIVLQDKPSIQIFLLLILSALWQYLILKARPYETQSLNIISYLNEVSVSFYLYLALLLSDYLESQIPASDPFFQQIRHTIAWILTGIFIFTIAMNFLYFFVKIILGVVRRIKAKIQRQREVKYSSQEQNSESRHQIEINNQEISAISLQLGKNNSTFIEANSFEDYRGIYYVKERLKEQE